MRWKLALMTLLLASLLFSLSGCGSQGKKDANKDLDRPKIADKKTPSEK